MKERRMTRPRAARVARVLKVHAVGAESAEVALHELGESLVASAVSIQRELRRYSEDNGAFLLEDLEVELPVKMRVDSLGQMMAEVVNETAPNGVLTRIRLRIRPDAQPTGRIPIIADAPLACLKTLTKEHVTFLASHRIFTVEDVIRASRSAAVRQALELVIPPAVLDASLARGSILLIPVVPARVAMALLNIGLKSVDEFLRRDPGQLAVLLVRALGEPVSKELVARWQENLTKLRALASQSAETARLDATIGTVSKAVSQDRALSS